ncbi:MAG: alpha/beta hydrolase [Actinomycetota bacterium]|nr:alpha/beta hydrolase [Actinomycetota bacterium]
MLRFVTSGKNTRIAVRVAGEPDSPPIVLVHGWGQSGEVWSAQVDDLARDHYVLAPDLRGHGESDEPETGYDDPAAWADDLAAVLDLAGSPAIVVGWSYGGLVVTDYVRERGCVDLAGIVLVGALTEIGRDRPGGVIGPAMRAALPDILSADPGVAIPAVMTLTAGMTADPMSGAEIQRAVGRTLRVSPRVRKALFRRDVDSAEVLAGITVPTLIAHGTEDAVVHPSAAEYAAGKIPGALTRWFTAAGHSPFAERADEFNRALRELVAGRKG